METAKNSHGKIVSEARRNFSFEPRYLYKKRVFDTATKRYGVWGGKKRIRDETIRNNSRCKCNRNETTMARRYKKIARETRRNFSYETIHLGEIRVSNTCTSHPVPVCFRIRICWVILVTSPWQQISYTVAVGR